jgi:TIR domain
MKVTRIFVSYEAGDEAFATQLMNDLRDAGLEVITDHTDLVDTAFEQFLAQELPQCQHLIVVQTPAALQSSRVQAIVDTALKHVQADQMTGVLSLIAPAVNTVEAAAVPPTWSTIPTFDASQDYLRALARLSLHLGLLRPSPKAPPPGPRSMQKVTRSLNPHNRQKVSPLPDPQSMQRVASPPDPQSTQKAAPLPDPQNRQKVAPPPNSQNGQQLALPPDPRSVQATQNALSVLNRSHAQPPGAQTSSYHQGIRNRPPISGQPYAQQSNTRDRPLRPFKYQPKRRRRLRLARTYLVLLSIITLLSIGGFALFSAVHRTPPKAIVATPTAVVAPTATPAPPPVPFTGGSWQGLKSFANGQPATDMLLTITLSGNTISGNLNENGSKDEFVIDGTITGSSANGTQVEFSDSATLSKNASCSGCIYEANVFNKQMTGVWFLPGSPKPAGTFILNQQP